MDLVLHSSVPHFSIQYFTQKRANQSTTKYRQNTDKMKTMSMNLLNSVLILLTISSYGETFFVPRAHNINFHKPFDLKRMLAKKKGNTAGATIVLEVTNISDMYVFK